MATTTIQIDDGTAPNDGTGTTLRAFAALFNAFNFSFGDYTPALTNGANVAASTAYPCQFLRVGNVVHVSGRIDVDPTIVTITTVGISLPIASNLATTSQCAGVGASTSIAGAGGIYADVTNNRAELTFVTTNVANQDIHFTFTYLVI